MLEAFVYTLGTIGFLILSVAGLLKHRAKPFKKIRQLAIVGVLCIVAALALYWIPHFVQSRPNTYVFIYGQEFSYPEPLLGKGMLHYDMSLVHPEEPPNVKSQVAVDSFYWDYPENTKLYNVAVHNMGNKLDSNVQVTLDFTPNFIFEFENLQEDKVTIVSGGLNATRIVFEIDKILSNTIQPAIKIVVDGVNIPSIAAKSENNERLEQIYIYDIGIKPMSGWVAYIDANKRFAVSLPEHWVLVEPASSPLLAGPLSEELKFLALVEIWQDEVPDSMNTQTALKTRRERLPWGDREYIHLSEEETELGGLSGYKDMYEWNTTDMPWRLMVFYLIEENTEWFLQFSASPNRWSDYDQVFDDIAHSFQTRFVDYWIKKVPRE
ncbi:hypothetical protein ACFLXV_02225 [Chloroflexota bacterium]